MFEREIRDLSFVPRWGIARTRRTQSVAEHSYYVAIYALDIATFLGMSEVGMASLARRALWHDVDEIFTGDMPGPAKRQLTTDKEHAAGTVWQWFSTVFGYSGAARLRRRTGLDQPEPWDSVTYAILKVADELEASMFIAEEMQMGNTSMRKLAEDSARRLAQYIWAIPTAPRADLEQLLQLCVRGITSQLMETSKNTEVFLEKNPHAVS